MVLTIGSRWKLGYSMMLCSSCDVLFATGVYMYQPKMVQTTYKNIKCVATRQKDASMIAHLHIVHRSRRYSANNGSCQQFLRF
jgi:hypothetical protein